MLLTDFKMEECNTPIVQQCPAKAITKICKDVLKNVLKKTLEHYTLYMS